MPTKKDVEIWDTVNNAEENIEIENGIKEAALLDLLKQMAGSKGDISGGLRTTEICELTGWGPGKVRRQLHLLKSQGKIEVVRIQLKATDVLNDRKCFGTAYRLVEAEDDD